MKERLTKNDHISAWKEGKVIERDETTYEIQEVIPCRCCHRIEARVGKGLVPVLVRDRKGL